MKHTLKKWLSILLAACLLMALAPSALMEEPAEVQEEVAEIEATEPAEEQEESLIFEEEAVTPEEVIEPSEGEDVKPSKEESFERKEVAEFSEGEVPEFDEEIAIDAVDEIVEEATVDLDDLVVNEDVSNDEIIELEDLEGQTVYAEKMFAGNFSMSKDDFLKAAYACEGGGWADSMCLGWVKSFWVSQGGPESTDCCARHYFENRISSTSRDNIPIGADIFLYDVRSNPTICGKRGGACGHIGIYVGDGKFISTLTSNGSTKIRIRSISDWESWGYSFAGWGWHDGITVVDDSSGYTAETAYFERCTYKIVKAFDWRSGPSTGEAKVGSASVGETFTTDRVIWNKTTNNMWVKKAGEEKYVFAGLHYSDGKWSVDNSQTQYLQFVSNDATVNWSGCNVGGSHKKGEKLALQGSITCSNSMKSVQGQFYNGSSPYGNSTSKFGAGGTTYSVPASSLDYALAFGSLPASNNMKLIVTVEHYYNRGQSVGTKAYEVGFRVCF